MTQNQIAYWKLKEEERSNKAQEAENVRHNKETEFIQSGTLAENARHNLVSEGIAFDTLAETRRSNQARENETHRTNVANEQLKHESNVFSREVGMAQVAESRRHNITSENEEARHHMATEEYSYFSTNTERILRERGYDIQEGQLHVSEGQLELNREEAYGGKGYDSQGRTDASHAFSGSGTGSGGITGTTPTLQREIETEKLKQGAEKNLQNWFSIGGELLDTSSKLVERGLSYLVPLLE